MKRFNEYEIRLCFEVKELDGQTSVLSYNDNENISITNLNEVKDIFYGLYGRNNNGLLENIIDSYIKQELIDIKNCLNARVHNN